MSLLTTCKCNLIGANVSQELLGKAVEFVAKKHGGELTQTVMRQKVLAGFIGGGLGYGIGVRQSGDGIEFIYDSADNHSAPQIKKEIENTYKKMALVRAVANMDFEIETERINSHVIRIKGEK